MRDRSCSVVCVVFLISLCFLPACAPAYWVAMKFMYDKVELPPDRVVMNIGYDPSATDDHKRQLDLYLPEGRDFATVIFIHGGGWAWGRGVAGGAGVVSMGAGAAPPRPLTSARPARGEVARWCSAIAPAPNRR